MAICGNRDFGYRGMTSKFKVFCSFAPVEFFPVQIPLTSSEGVWLAAWWVKQFPLDKYRLRNVVYKSFFISFLHFFLLLPFAQQGVLDQGGWGDSLFILNLVFSLNSSPVKNSSHTSIQHKLMETLNERGIHLESVNAGVSLLSLDFWALQPVSWIFLGSSFSNRWGEIVPLISNAS